MRRAVPCVLCVVAIGFLGLSGCKKKGGGASGGSKVCAETKPAAVKCASDLALRGADNDKDKAGAIEKALPGNWEKRCGERAGESEVSDGLKKCLAKKDNCAEFADCVAKVTGTGFLNMKD